jgi:hypothetical protein
MALYEYQGQEYDIATDDPTEAKAKILSHLGKDSSFLKDAAGEVAAGARVVAGAPEFVFNALGVPVQAGKQLLLGEELNWKKAKEDATRVAAPLGKVAEGVDYLVDKFNLREEFESSKVNQGMTAVTKGVEWVGERTEEQTGVPKEATIAALDVGMLGVGVPGIKPIARMIERRVAPDLATSSTKPVVDSTGVALQDRSTAPVVYARPDATFNPDQYVKDSLETPATALELKGFDDSLYTLNNMSKLDMTEALNVRTELEKMGVSPDLQEKFRRYDEQQALGNEKINNDIFETNKELNTLYADNAALFKEGDYRSNKNPEGTTGWRDFQYKEQVRDNYKTIAELKQRKAELEAKRGTKEELTPAEKEIYQRYFEPQRTEIMRLSEYMQKEGIVPEFGKDPSGAFAPRKVVPKSLEEKSIGETYKEAIIGRDYTEQMLDVNRTADAGQQRSFFVLETPTGVREVFAINEGKDSYGIFKMENGKPGAVLNLPKSEFKLQAGEKIGDRTVKEASVAELELNVGRKYLKDYSLTMGERLADLREQARIHEYSKDLIKNKDLAWKAETKYDVPPEGWRQLQYTDKMPLLREFYFPEKHAEMLDDFNQPPIRDNITKFNNALVTNMMLVPIAHMHNELFHWGMTKGASGFLNPKKLAGMKGIVEATKEVLNRGDFYKEILREGGSLMSTNIKNSTLMDTYYQKSLDTFKGTSTFKELAKAAAVTPAKLYAGMSKFSNKAMWTVRDILYTQLIKDKMDKGLSMKEAIDSVERHMPNYRLGSRLITEGKSGRVLSKALGNRHAFLFARYHAGMIGSAKNTIKDLLLLDPSVKKTAQFKEGLDSSLAVALGLSVLYPLLDDLAGMVVDVLDSEGVVDPDAVHVRRPGISHVFQTAADIAKDEKDPYALSSILVTPTPALAIAAESVWNYEWYNRRDIRTPGADLEVQADQYLKYLANKVPQAGQAIRATGDLGTGTLGIFLRNFMDIQTKSPDQVERIENQVERRESAAENVNEEYEGLFLR